MEDRVERMIETLEFEVNNLLEEILDRPGVGKPSDEDVAREARALVEALGARGVHAVYHAEEQTISVQP
jgi:hypothetical protein